MTRTHGGYAPRWLSIRKRVLLRDDFVCALCGRAGANSVDHIVPKSKGGTHEMDNLRAAHMSCNAARGNRTVIALPMARSRRWRVQR
jgi:5-methylcytosine-specific restriction endonuclease McrA